MAASLVLALPQVPGFLQGLSRYAGSDFMSRAAMDAARVPHFFLYFMSNFTLRLPEPAGVVLLPLLVLALLRFSWRRRQRGLPVDARWLLTFLAGATFLLMVAANEVANVMTGSRIRYMMPLFPLLALLAAEALRLIRAKARLAVAAFLAFWLALGPILLNAGPLLYVDRHHSTFHLVQRWLQQRAGADDLVVLDSSLKNRGEVLYLAPRYIPLSDQSWETVFRNRHDPQEWAAPALSPYVNLWVIHQPDDAEDAAPTFMAPGHTLCQRIEDLAGFTLQRFNKTAAGCSDT